MKCDSCKVELQRGSTQERGGVVEFLECPQCKGAVFDRNTPAELRQLFTGEAPAADPEPPAFGFGHIPGEMFCVLCDAETAAECNCK